MHAREEALRRLLNHPGDVQQVVGRVVERLEGRDRNHVVAARRVPRARVVVDAEHCATGAAQHVLRKGQRALDRLGRGALGVVAHREDARERNADLGETRLKVGRRVLAAHPLPLVRLPHRRARIVQIAGGDHKQLGDRADAPQKPVRARPNHHAVRKALVGDGHVAGDLKVADEREPLLLARVRVRQKERLVEVEQDEDLLRVRLVRRHLVVLVAGAVARVAQKRLGRRRGRCRGRAPVRRVARSNSRGRG